MPRYDIDYQAVADLASYLRRLSAATAPGVTADALHLATVATPDAPPGEADAVLGVLRAWGTSAPGGSEAWRLHMWDLKGPSDSWDAQLVAHYREQPVFAVLSGAGGAEWEPVQRSCEAYRVPCVFPSVELTPENTEGYYSLYFLPGVALEARVLARYLDNRTAPHRHLPYIIQLYSDPSGRATAQALRAALGKGAGKITERRYRPSAPLAALDGPTGEEVLILWLRSDEIAALTTSLPQSPAAEVFLSDLLAPSDTISLPANWKRHIGCVSLFDDLGLQGEIARLRLQHWLTQAGLAHEGDLRVRADAFTACYLFNGAIAEIPAEEIRRPAVPLSREHVLEELEKLTSNYSDGAGIVDPYRHVAYYGRMSLGPGQRVAVHGRVILRYAEPESGKLVAASTRIVP